MTEHFKMVPSSECVARPWFPRSGNWLWIEI